MSLNNLNITKNLLLFKKVLQFFTKIGFTDVIKKL